MLKNLSRLESIVEGKVGHFMCDMDTPITLVRQMLSEFEQYIVKVEESVKFEQEKLAAEKQKEIENNSQDISKE